MVDQGRFKTFPVQNDDHLLTVLRPLLLSDLIEELGLGEKTIVIIASDNGAHREGGNGMHSGNCGNAEA